MDRDVAIDGCIRFVCSTNDDANFGTPFGGRYHWRVTIASYDAWRVLEAACIGST
jgi:hypothetical protein